LFWTSNRILRSDFCSSVCAVLEFLALIHFSGQSSLAVPSGFSRWLFSLPGQGLHLPPVSVSSTWTSVPTGFLRCLSSILAQARRRIPGFPLILREGTLGARCCLSALSSPDPIDVCLVFVFGFLHSFFSHRSDPISCRGVTRPVSRSCSCAWTVSVFLLLIRA
jgi:hypothetical protein